VGYLRKCFANPAQSFGSHPKSLNDCFDWSTVRIQGNEEVDYVNECVGDFSQTTNDLETDHPLLKEDREWALTNRVHLHPSVTVNNMTYTNSTGHDLAMSIC